MSKNQDWSEYYEFMRGKPPTAILVEAIGYLKYKNKAIDIGGGSLRDTQYLIKEGFDVTVVDNSPLLLSEANRIKSVKLHPVVASFEEYVFLKDEYNLASAIFALNFCDQIKFDGVFEKIKGSLKSGGILCAELYGNYDEWSKIPEKTYPSKEKIVKLLTGLEMIKFSEEKIEREDKRGGVKYKHILRFIARK